MKKLETFTIFDFYRRGQNLSCFYHFLSFFINFFYHFRRNRGKWINTIKKWWKTIKIDKQWKKLETLIIFSFFEPSQGDVWGWGRSARQGMSARGVLGEVCARGGLQGRSVRRGLPGSARGGLPGESWRGGMGGQGRPGEVCQGRSARAS